MSKTPFQCLPMPAPREHDPGTQFFYQNIVKPMIPDFIEIMHNGLLIDEKAVDTLRVTVKDVLASVEKTLANNPLIQQYQEHSLPRAQKKYEEKTTQSIRTVDHYIKSYKPDDILHRTWVVNTYLDKKNKAKYKQDKWTIKDLKQLNGKLQDTFLEAIITKRKMDSNISVKSGMLKLAEHKLSLWNKPRYDKAKKKVDVQPFNPGSNKQKQEFFALNGIQSLTQSKTTGDDSWNRENVEFQLTQTTDKHMKEVLQALVDHSYSAIILNNFLNSFDKFTIDGVLHGILKLFGAKTFRPTSEAPNLLNMPSSRSIYAKPLKRCFIAPKGRIIYTADLGALEDRVLANLTNDTNKKNIFLEGLDGHSLNACGYFPDRIAKIMGPNTNNVPYVKEFYKLVDTNPTLDKIRFDSKAPTFKLAYGGFPDDDKGGVITQQIFDNYHNVLYPGVTDYRERYVLPITKHKGYIHLGLGCRMYTNKADANIRTLHNATIQFWSVLTLIAVNEFRRRVEEAGLSHRISVISTIYDSIYLSIDEDPELIQWVNNNLIPIMCVDYLENQQITNVAEGFIGKNFADLHKLTNNCSVSDIINTLQKVYDD